MKKIFLLLVAGVLFLVSCNNDKKQVTVTAKDGTATVNADLEKAQEAAAQMQNRSAELQKLSPYTLDQLKAMLPGELAGGKRNKLSANAYAGTSAATAEYVIDDSTGVDLNVLDCAGQAGAGIYNTQFLMAMNLQSETERESVRTIDFNGEKAIEQIRKDNGKASLTWLAADRLLVTLEGRNTGIELLKEAASSLSLK